MALNVDGLIRLVKAELTPKLDTVALSDITLHTTNDTPKLRADTTLISLISTVGFINNYDHPLIVKADVKQQDNSIPEPSEVQNLIQKLSLQVSKLASSNHSGSIRAINDGDARKTIQVKLYQLLDIAWDTLEKDGKKLNDAHVLKLISPFQPNDPKTKELEIDVYFGMYRPERGYQLKDTPTEVYILDGTVSEFVDSLNNQKVTKKLESPTSNTIPKPFMFYNIMEVSTGSDYLYKLIQVERQLQYIVARQFVREETRFFRQKSKKNTDEGYRHFIGNHVLSLVGFCGLCFPNEWKVVKDKLKDIIKSSPLRFPCITALSKKKRFLYMKNVTIAGKLELFGEKLERITERLDLLEKKN